jgi:hypothetical protein
MSFQNLLCPVLCQDVGFVFFRLDTLDIEILLLAMLSDKLETNINMFGSRSDLLILDKKHCTHVVFQNNCSVETTTNFPDQHLRKGGFL